MKGGVLNNPGLHWHYAGQKADGADRAEEGAGDSGAEQQNGESIFGSVGETAELRLLGFCHGYAYVRSTVIAWSILRLAEHAMPNRSDREALCD